MIAKCRDRFPDQTWIVGDMRTLDLGSRFDAIIAWNSFFHLTQDEQRRVFPDLRRQSQPPKAALIFTSGPRRGEAIGSYKGEPLFHGSVDPDERRALLHEHGFEVILHVAEDPTCGGHTVWAGTRMCVLEDEESKAQTTAMLIRIRHRSDSPTRSQKPIAS